MRSNDTTCVPAPGIRATLCVSHRADRLPRPSCFATPCNVFTGLAAPSLTPALSPFPPFPFLPGLAHLLLALSPPVVAGDRERYTSRAERPVRLRSCRLLISLSCSKFLSIERGEQRRQRLSSSRTIQIFCTYSSNSINLNPASFGE